MNFSRPRVTLIVLPLVVVVGLVSASRIYAVEPPPPKTLAALVERIRAILPPGWTVEEEVSTGALVVARNAKVLAVAVPPSAAAMEPEPEKQVFAYCFRLSPLMPVAEFRRLSLQNQRARDEIRSLRTEAFRVFITKKEDGSTFAPASEKNLALAVRYQELSRSFHRLPDFYFEDASVWSIHPDSPSILDDATRQECAEVRVKVERLFSRYPTR